MSDTDEPAELGAIVSEIWRLNDETGSGDAFVAARIIRDLRKDNTTLRDYVKVQDEALTELRKRVAECPVRITCCQGCPDCVGIGVREQLEANEIEIADLRKRVAELDQAQAYEHPQECYCDDCEHGFRSATKKVGW